MGAVEYRFKQETYDRLISLEDELTRFSERLGHVVNVYAAAEQVTKGKPFFIYHREAWDMLAASRDMLIVDLSSWAKGMYRPNGFVASLALELAALRVPWDNAPPIDDPDNFMGRHVQDLNHQWRARAYGRLFPNADPKRLTSCPSREGRPSPSSHAGPLQSEKLLRRRASSGRREGTRRRLDPRQSSALSRRRGCGSGLVCRGRLLV